MLRIPFLPPVIAAVGAIVLTITSASPAIASPATDPPQAPNTLLVRQNSSPPTAFVTALTVFIDSRLKPRFEYEDRSKRRLAHSVLPNCFQITRGDTDKTQDITLIAVRILDKPGCDQPSYDTDLTLYRTLYDGGHAGSTIAVGSLRLTAYNDRTLTARCLPAPRAAVTLTCTDIVDATQPSPHNLSVRFALPLTTTAPTGNLFGSS